MFNPRKLAAIDIVFLGSKLIITEFAAGVLLPAGLGAFILLRAHSFGQVALGLYFIALGINYAPLLYYAIALTAAESARAEMGEELEDTKRAFSRYRRASLLLLVPLVVPIFALWHKRPAKEA